MSTGSHRSHLEAFREAQQTLHEQRRRLSYRLHTDVSFASIDAMSQMAATTEWYVRRLGLPGKNEAVWLSGSLGRCEMLPNSDLDLFLIKKRLGSDSVSTSIPKDGFDMFELAIQSLEDVRGIVSAGSIDANPYIDGRALETGLIADTLEDLITSMSTYDRQIANFVSEFAYYHYFDFIWKRTAYGVNLKYSSGSARATLFFNFHNRIITGRFPMSRDRSPEFLEGLRTAESRLARSMPRREIELVQVVKNAAITAYYERGDPRLRYVSRYSLDGIFEICSRRLYNLNVRDRSDFFEIYCRARQAVEGAVSALLGSVLRCHPLAALFMELTSMPPSAAADRCGGLADAYPEHRASLLAVTGWSCVVRRPPAHVVTRLASLMVEHGIEASWGGLMAVACSATADEETLIALLQWLDSHERGVYLTKLIARNPAATPVVRRRAIDSYRRRERVQQYDQRGYPVAKSDPLRRRPTAYEA